MDWKWEENSILNDYSPYTPCNEIFHAVCDEIGRYYSAKGFRYAKSRPKITCKDQNIKLDIAFWSSGHNIPGDYVNLEILPAFYSIHKNLKNAYLLGHPAIFIHPLPDRSPGTVQIQQIYGDVIERYEERYSEAILKLSHSCNVYGITTEQFGKIIEFIDHKIIAYLDIIKNKELLIEFIESSNKERSYYLNDSNLKDYIEIAFSS